jgi:hypothetical protein
MGVVDDRRAVRRPARVGDAGAAVQPVRLDVGSELGDPGGAARPAQPAGLVQGDAARVVTAVLEAAQALDQDRDDVARADGADDSALGRLLVESGTLGGTLRNFGSDSRRPWNKIPCAGRDAFFVQIFY